MLDDGCGTGNVIATLIDQFGEILPSNARLLASDYSSGMVASVDELKNSPENASSPIWQRLETHVLNAKDLVAGGANAPIKAGSLSHIVSNMVLMAVDDPRAAVRSPYAALIPGGVLVFTAWSATPWIDSWAHAKSLFPTDVE